MWADSALWELKTHDLKCMCPPAPERQWTGWFASDSLRAHDMRNEKQRKGWPHLLGYRWLLRFRGGTAEGGRPRRSFSRRPTTLFCCLLCIWRHRHCSPITVNTETQESIVNGSDEISAVMRWQSCKVSSHL